MKWIRLRCVRIVTLLVTIGLLTVASALIYIRIVNHSNGELTYAEVSKLIVYGYVSDEDISEIEKSGDSGYWYEQYIEMTEQLGISGFDVDRANKSIRKADVYRIFCQDLGLSDQITTSELNEKLFGMKDDNGCITKKDFIDIYMGLLDGMPYGTDIKRIEAGIAGTPLTLDKAHEWEVYTTEGVYQFKGLVMDGNIDKTLSLIVRGEQIIAIDGKVSDEVQYKNIWIKNGQGSAVETNVYGADRTFTVKGLSENVQNTLADISVENGKITAISIKNDEIAGKVLSVSGEYVEIDGYGKVPLDKDFMIYDIYNGFSVKTYEDIVVGYSLQNFIVADGNVCGAVISRPLNVDNIRVILKDTAADSIYHADVSITSDVGYTISYGETVERHAAGEAYSINTDNPAAVSERILAQADDGGQITVLDMNRSQGVPAYEGKIEVSLYDGGFVIVNDISIESYLKRVVPSEMPVSFGVEALKVQAVCARSYAYNQLTNSYYGQFGAHVDDSTLFQVYNNTSESEASNIAIAETKGQVLRYGTQVVQAYYYSTSCGATTDVGLWGSDPSAYPFFQSTDVSRTVKNLNLTDEQAFEQFITTKNEQDYDYNCSLYRWELDVPLDTLSDSFNSKLYGRCQAAAGKIQVLNANGQFEAGTINSVGRIKNVQVNSRANGGAITSVTVTGTDATVRIESESCIRALFGCKDVTMTTNTGTTKMASLPSTFCIFRVYADTAGKSSNIKIIGGGYGHGIGMSQNAVKAMTDDGMSFVQVLQFFYKGTEVGTP